MKRWPSATALASAKPSEVLRAWDRLGYPRRALWMHAAARQMVELHGGRVPRDDAALRALPGVGPYTAAAIRAFAFKQRAVVVDVNVRRLHSRLYFGADASPTAISRAELEHYEQFLPPDPLTAATLSQAVMEFGALICTAANPKCSECPLRQQCEWVKAGSPVVATKRRLPGFAGTDRQCRGVLMKALRDAETPVTPSLLEAAWTDALQRRRCLESLVADGLIVPMTGGRYGLPGDHVVN